MQIDSRHLRAFVMVAQTRHFGRAAASLGIAQSALSAQLVRLEDVVGGRLLERGRRSAVELTKAGKVFLSEAVRAVEGFDRVQRLGHLAVRGRAGTAHLGYVFSAAMTGILSSVLSKISQAMPEIALKASLMETSDQIAALSNAELELGLFRPWERYSPDIETRVIHTESLLLAFSASHPMADLPVLTASSLTSETFIMPSTGGRIGMETAVAELARQNGELNPRIVPTGDFVTAISMAAAGQGFVLCPQSLSRLNIPNIVYRPLADFSGTATLVLGWRVPASEFVESVNSAFTD